MEKGGGEQQVVHYYSLIPDPQCDPEIGHSRLHDHHCPPTVVVCSTSCYFGICIFLKAATSPWVGREEMLRCFPPHSSICCGVVQHPKSPLCGFVVVVKSDFLPKKYQCCLHSVLQPRNWCFSNQLIRS